jgi:hypothetical protein
VDRPIFDDDKDKQSLRACGMYTFFQISGMRTQWRLINILIDYWFPDVDAFMLTGKSLTIIVEEIYFMTSLSRRGEVKNFQTRGGGWSINAYINEYCDTNTEKSGSQVPVKQITNLSL